MRSGSGEKTQSVFQEGQSRLIWTVKFLCRGGEISVWIWLPILAEHRRRGRNHESWTRLTAGGWVCRAPGCLAGEWGSGHGGDGSGVCVSECIVSSTCLLVLTFRTKMSPSLGLLLHLVHLPLLGTSQ